MKSSQNSFQLSVIEMFLLSLRSWLQGPVYAGFKKRESIKISDCGVESQTWHHSGPDRSADGSPCFPHLALSSSFYHLSYLKMLRLDPLQRQIICPDLFAVYVYIFLFLPFKALFQREKVKPVQIPISNQIKSRCTRPDPSSASIHSNLAPRPPSCLWLSFH